MVKCAFAMLSAIGLSFGFCGCSTAPKSDAAKTELHAEIEESLAIFRARPALEKFFAASAGYAIFPSVGKGGFIVGAAHGRGEVYEQGKFVGYCDITQGTIGLQIGGQAFRQIIFFQFKDSLDRFKRNDFEFAANASAVAADAAAATTTDYRDGSAVFIMGIGGLMAEASIGGQKFNFVPVY